jgi:uncharacterized repeat protein (TIGR02543 family)
MERQVTDTATALRTNAFTRPGYTFEGWTTEANGTGTAFEDAAVYPFTASTTLYAKWNKISYTWLVALLVSLGASLIWFRRRLSIQIRSF